MSALLNIKQFVRFDEHGNLNVPNKLFVACQAYVQTPLLNDTSSRVATTEWVRAQISSLTGISVSETDPIWVFEKALYYTKVQADARYLQSFTETDPTVPAWAKTSVKPTYTFSELLSKPTTIAGYGITDIPTTLPASDVYAWAKAATKPSYAYSEITGLPTLFSGNYTDLTNKPTLFSGAYADLTGKPTLFSGAYADLTGKPTIPTNNNQLTNGAGYLTSYTETDPIWTAEKTNYALKTYVDTSVSNLVASAPATLNTLNELALALGSDANFSTTVATSIGNRVPYIGATQSVNLGIWDLDAANLFSNGLGIYIKKNASGLANAVGYVALSSTTYKLGIAEASGGTTGKSFNFDFAGLTDNITRTFTLPNLSGTLALLEGSQTFTGSKTFSATTLVNTIYIDGVSYLKNLTSTSYITGYTTYSAKANGVIEYFFPSSFKSVLDFNDAADYTYTFPASSGTIALTSNLSAYLPLTGGTLTGALNGTSATFSGAVTNDNGLKIKFGSSANLTASYLTLSAYGETGSFPDRTVLRIGTSDTYFSLIKFRNNTSYTYDTPAASGTLALTSDIPSLSNYVTLDGSQTISGAKTFSAIPVIDNGLSGMGLRFKMYSSSSFGLNGYMDIAPINNTGIVGFAFGISSTVTKLAYFSAAGLTDNTAREYTLPNASGTLALTSNLSAYVPTTRTITINGTAYNLSEDRAWTITTSSAYTLPTASTTVLGGIKVGTNLSIDVNGVLSSTDTNTWNANTKDIAGYVAAPGAVANKVWKTDANGNPGWRDDADTDTNTTYSVFTGATASANGTSGLVTAPVIADRVKYLKGDGTWGTPTDTTYAAFTGSTTLVDGAAGLVPKPVVANRLQYLRGDGTWATPPDTDTDTNTVTSIRREDSDGTTGATTYRTGDIRLRQGANVTISEVSAGVFQISSSYVDTDTNTWNANSKTVAGYVSAPGDVANKVWKTDATGNPGWRDDADTDTNTTYTAGIGLTLTGTVFSVTKTITAAQTADTIALRNADGQLVATGFYQASSRALKTNINPFTKSALDIIREVAVVSFNYKTDIINKHIGFIAEDTPEELSTRNKNVMDSNNTIGLLLKAVQELEARIKQLESK